MHRKKGLDLLVDDDQHRHRQNSSEYGIRWLSSLSRSLLFPPMSNVHYCVRLNWFRWVNFSAILSPLDTHIKQYVYLFRTELRSDFTGKFKERITGSILTDSVPKSFLSKVEISSQVYFLNFLIFLIFPGQSEPLTLIK